MLIVQITLSFFSHGAVMRRARQEIKALLNAGHQVIVITDLRWKSAVHEMKDYKDKLLIIPLKPFYIHRPFRMISSQISFAYKAYLALKKLSKTKKIDLIVSHASTVSYTVAHFGRRKNIVSTWVIQDLIRDRMATGNPYNCIETLMLKNTDPYALKHMNFIITVSKYSKKLALMDGANPANTFIKYNAIDTIIFSPKEGMIKDIDILFFGRLSIEKGIDILIDATDYISKDKRITIIGDGPLINKLKKQAKNKKQKIKFLGFIDHQLLPQYICRAKLVVTPSRSECHAVVPLEAMACGVPVIASRVAGMEDSIIHNKSGWLLDKNDPKTLGNMIENILSDENNLKNISKEAIKRADQFSEKRFNIEIVRFYEMLVRKYKS